VLIAAAAAADRKTGAVHAGRVARLIALTPRTLGHIATAIQPSPHVATVPAKSIHPVHLKIADVGGVSVLLPHRYGGRGADLVRLAPSLGAHRVAVVGSGRDRGHHGGGCGCNKH